MKQETVSKELWAYDDPRIDRLHAGEMDLSTFLRETRPTDPWDFVMLRNGQNMSPMVKALSPEQVEEQNAKRKAAMLERMSKYGGMTGRLVFDKQDLFLAVFPELSEAVRRVSEEVKREKCVGCTLNKRTGPLLDSLLALPVAGRNLAPLASILPPVAMRRLQAGAPLPLEGLELPANLPLKQVLPLRTSPRDGEPKVVLNANPSSRAPWERPQAPTGYAPRKPCPDCARKHLAKAVAQLEEYVLGYPRHRWLAIGNLSEAEAEIIGRYPDIAQRIREMRLEIIARKGHAPDVGEFIDEITKHEEEAGNE